ncbi:hypothetical protein PR202_ga29344 [Eleusine coracana subsp. coracana]|uniref:Myb/SANT-like domain-containing protein n=1 Tax=Eleusine coracana subsp. coracana TaxID=191504 RepID=A0AAV5DLS5_ELECO|nr:hypothetical protein PR202_ga29344 [Eleusine coracana subsp. coracana]
MPDIDWDSESLRVLCQLFAEQVERGNRPNTHLNSIGYAEIEKGLKDRIGKVACKQQIKNKWDKLKEEFKAWKKLMLRQTGTGWCPIKGTIIMDDEWWKKARKVIPGCGKFEKLGLQNEDELQKCFGDIISVGNDHWSPHMGNVAPSVQGNETQVEVDIDLTQQQDDAVGEGGDTNEVEQISPVNANGKRPPRPIPDKGKKTKTGTALTIQEVVTSMATSANSYASNKQGKYSIDEVMEHMIACGATYKTNEHFIASELFVKKEQREMFMTLPNNEIRFSWLTRKYVAKYGN